MGKALELVLAEPWAIMPESLEQIMAIAERVNESPEAVAAKLGRPLENTRKVEMRGNVAVIPVTGPIFRRANMFTEISGATSIEVLARDFNAALGDKQVESIVLDISSPGGQAAGISEFAAMVRASNKPVTAYVGDMAASAAYWIAAAAQELIVSDTAMLGSIGVVASFRPSPKGEIKIISSQSPLKQADPGTDEGRAEVQRVVDDIAAVFISAVAGYRGTNEEAVMSTFGRGGILIGAKAAGVGMADKLGSFENTIAGLSGATTSTEGFTMADQKPNAPDITRAYLAEHHPDLVASLQKEGEDKALTDLESLVSEAKTSGADAERERIKAVEDQAMPGHDKLIAGMKFDGKTTGPEAAVAVLAAEKESRAEHLKKVTADTPEPVPGLSNGEELGQEDATFESKVEAHQAAGLTRGKAMATAARENPELHKKWLARINTQAAS